MNHIIPYLLKEEMRLHSALRGRRSFLLFPLLLLLGTLITSLALLNYSTITVNENTALTFIIIFSMFGFVSGMFGLHASDYLERRFGDYGKLFANMFIQPIPIRKIFLATAITDSLFYLGWFILPILLGLGGATLFLGISTAYLPLLMLSVLLAFILGLSISFFLSVLVTKSKALFYLSLGLLVASVAYYKKGIIIPFLLYQSFSLPLLLLNIGVILLFFFITGLILGNEYQSIRTKQTHKSHSFKKTNPYLYKDFIDLSRTHGLIIKPLLNVAIPSLLLLGLFSTITLFQGDLSLMTHNLVFAAILLGTMSINFFNVLLGGGLHQLLPIPTRQTKGFHQAKDNLGAHNHFLNWSDLARGLCSNQSHIKLAPSKHHITPKLHLLRAHHQRLRQRTNA